VLAVGDSNFQQKCLEEFNKYRDLGKTVILVTHDISTIQKYCDRAMLLRKGKIEMIGDPEEVGNKYIYQNMSDEEKRIFDEERKMREKTEKELEERKKAGKNQSEKKKASKKAEREKPKKKIAEITKVEILDKDGNKKNVFKTGDEIDIIVSCLIYKPTKNPIFGIIIKDLQKNPIFVTNTDFKKIKTGQFSKGKTQVIFNVNNHFASGKYFVSPAIAKDDAKTFYDWKDDFASFSVINSYNSGGIVDLKHEIKIQ